MFFFCLSLTIDIEIRPRSDDLFAYEFHGSNMDLPADCRNPCELKNKIKCIHLTKIKCLICAALKVVQLLIYYFEFDSHR
jgi:hypothetical protein